MPFHVPLVTVPNRLVPVTARLEVVAFVDVEFTVVRFVIVDDAVFAMKPPVKYERPVVVAAPIVTEPYVLLLNLLHCVHYDTLP